MPAEQFRSDYPLLPGFQNRQSNCLWRSGVYAMTFSYCDCRHSRTKLWQNLTATSGRWETRPFNRCCGSRGVQGLMVFCWRYFAGIQPVLRIRNSPQQLAQHPVRVPHALSSNQLEPLGALRAFKCCSQTSWLVQITFCKG